MKVREVNFVRRQQGWTCEITFTYVSGEQFTDPMQSVVSACYRWWFAAWWNARSSAKLYESTHCALPGERQKKGWAP
jgi:hypothetical protein